MNKPIYHNDAPIQYLKTYCFLLKQQRIMIFSLVFTNVLLRQNIQIKISAITFLRLVPQSVIIVGNS